MIQNFGEVAQLVEHRSEEPGFATVRSCPFPQIDIVQDIKPIVKGISQLQYILIGGIDVYHLNAVDGHVWQIEIDLSNKHDVGETAAFKPVEKGLILMRWIRKANENETLIKIS